VRFRVLGSGSSGNATLVEDEGTRILIDAGLGPRELADRLVSAGLDPASLSAIVLSHEHGDHVRGAASFSRRWGVRLAATHGTYAAAGLAMAEIAGYDVLTPFRPFAAGTLTVTAVPVPHDAAEPVAFVIRGAGGRLGHATDLGQVDRVLVDAFGTCDAVLIESNYDPTLLANGPYPWALKERIFGNRGHLSNADVARYLFQGLGDSCRQVVLAHLSEKNNHPEIVQASAASAIARRGRGDVRVDLTGREGTGWIEILGGVTAPAGAAVRPGEQLRLF
jgi:phosphoribosyl 1,2-cyclic phosphodiesterase